MMNQPIWMGIINLTPDSFSDGSIYNTSQKIIDKCKELVNKGAHIIDFGGVSSNPKIKNIQITPTEELKRVYEPIKLARQVIPQEILFSIDTFSPIVAHTLAQEGLINIINDIYAAQKYECINEKETKVPVTTAHVAAQFNLQLILMHMNPSFNPQPNEGILSQVKVFFDERIRFCKKIGAKKLILDPGIGYGRFGKSYDDILELLNRESIQSLKQLGFPILIGISRKLFLFDMDPTLEPPLSRDKLSKEIELKCISYGADIIRTHSL